MLSKRLNTLTPLILSPSEEDQKMLSDAKKGNEALTDALKKKIKCNFDQF